MASSIHDKHPNVRQLLFSYFYINQAIVFLRGMAVLAGTQNLFNQTRSSKRKVSERL